MNHKTTILWIKYGKFVLIAILISPLFIWKHSKTIAILLWMVWFSIQYAKVRRLEPTLRPIIEQMMKKEYDKRSNIRKSKQRRSKQ